MTAITLAQMTDTHLLNTPTAHLRGCCTSKTLHRVLQQVRSESVQGLLLTGDLADQGSSAAYVLLRELLAPLQIPCYWIPGNHDDVQAMTLALAQDPFIPDNSIRVGHWQVILLNSVLPNAPWGEGRLSADELSRLDTELRHSFGPTLIALHHHILPTGIDWLDQIQLHNSAQLLQLVAQYPQVKLIVSGHVHLASHHVQHQTHIYTTPSTGLQVVPQANTPDHLNWPGYRLITLYPDGTHPSCVRRCAAPDSWKVIMTGFNLNNAEVNANETEVDPVNAAVDPVNATVNPFSAEAIAANAEANAPNAKANAPNAKANAPNAEVYPFKLNSLVQSDVHQGLMLI